MNRRNGSTTDVPEADYAGYDNSHGQAEWVNEMERQNDCFVSLCESVNSLKWTMMCGIFYLCNYLLGRLKSGESRLSNQQKRKGCPRFQS